MIVEEACGVISGVIALVLAGVAEKYCDITEFAHIGVRDCPL